MGLTDLHAAPGKQNRDAHSGTSLNDVRFFTKQNMAHTTHVLSVLLTQLNSFCRAQLPPLHNVVGIELINEPQANGALEKWYLETAHALRKLDPRVPLYFGDAWQTDQYATFIEVNSNSLAFMVLDHHLYRCFTQQDASTTVAQHTQNLRDPHASTPQLFARVAQKLDGAGGALVIGEWSGALNPGSMQNVTNEIEMRRDYIAAQVALYEKYCAGYYFWTYKKEHAGDKGWSFRDAVSAGVFPPYVGIRPDLIRNAKSGDSDGSSNSERAKRRYEAKEKALSEYSKLRYAMWDSDAEYLAYVCACVRAMWCVRGVYTEDHAGFWAQYPGKYEHWRFGEG